MYLFLSTITFHMLHLLSGGIYSLEIQRYPFEGILYAEMYPDSKYVRFSKTDRNEWKNLTNLVNSYDLNKKGIFCSLQSHSGWIAYPEANYFTDSYGSNEVTLLIGEGCIETDTIESIQPLLPLTRPSPPTLVTFKNPNFIGFANALDLKTIELGDPKLPTEIGSLILFGSKSWTLRSRNGSPRSVCIFAGQYVVDGKEHFFCPLMNLERELNLTGPLRIQRGCFVGVGEPEKVELTRCYSEGDHIIWTERATSHCKEELNLLESETVDKFAFIQYIWNRRVQLKTNNFKSFRRELISRGDMNQFTLPQEILNFFDVLEICIEFLISTCSKELNEEFWLTLKEVVLLQTSIFSQDIQRDFFIDAQTLEDLVNYLSTCKQYGNLSVSNDTAFDVVNPSSFLPTLQGPTETTDIVNSVNSPVGNEITSTSEATTLDKEMGQCGTHTEECDLTWDNISSHSSAEETNNTNSSFLSAFIENLVQFVSVKCTLTAVSELPKDPGSLLHSTVLLPFTKHFTNSQAHQYAFNGLGITKHLSQLKTCLCPLPDTTQSIVP